MPGFGSPGSIGKLFLTTFLFPFEIASILLLVAAVGAVVLARRRGGLEPDEQTEARIQAPRPAYTGTMAEAAGVRQVVHGEVARAPVGTLTGDGAGSAGSAGLAVRGSRARGRLVMNIGWYLAVSAIIFCIGAGGVLVRRNPLVILLCLELMLNAANLALVAFARMWGNEDGQVFALIVMVVAAAEVTVGLGLVVAIYRRQLPIDVDELKELQG